MAGDLPTGGRVARGEADIRTPSATRMEIGQSSSRAVVKWTDFSIGQGATVDIRQPGSKAAILNRVDGPATSRIQGALRANGQVFVANPNGVVIGPNGRIATGGGFVASSLGIGDDDFMAGRLQFDGDGHSARVSNEGSVTVGPGGFAALLGGRVSNAGSIVVPLGRVGLGAGERITLDVSGDEFMQVALPSQIDGEDGALIEHAGTIAAEGGRVEISAATARNAARYAVNLSGVVEARSISGRSGAIVLGGGDGGRLRVTGIVSTRPAAAPTTSLAPVPRPGGAITVTGARIELAGATVDVTGDTGGSVRIGGDWQGGGTLPWAGATLVDASSTIRADALGAGDGGTAVLWSGGHTDFAGTISARGGPGGGDGGAAEVSGHHLAFAGTVDLSAPAGAAGTLLLDPINVLISNGPAQNNETDAINEDTLEWFADGAPSAINADDLSVQLAGSNVVVSTTDFSDDPVGEAGNIIVTAPLSWSSNFALTLEADNDILLQAAISATTGGLVLDAADNITTSAEGSVDVGQFLLQAGNWEQNAATFPGSDLPNFEASDFAIANDGAPGNPSFLRVLGGSGSMEDPFLITDVYGLQGIDSAGYADDAFALANGIDGSGTAGWNGGDGFNPIGEEAQLVLIPVGVVGDDTLDQGDSGIVSPGAVPDEEGPFTPFFGSFDGNGFALSNFTVSGTTAGIFGATDGASISNLDLVNIAVSGSEFVGGLIGDAVDTVVDQVRIDATSTVTGTVGATDLAIGGLIGQLVTNDVTASLTNTVSSAAVVEQGTLIDDSVLSTDVGNLVGFNDGGAIATALAEGSVSASASEGPGLLFRRIGGAIGRNDGSVSQVYARGPVTVTGDGISVDVGGMSGVVFGNGSVVESYAAGPISAPEDATVGGFIGADSIEFGSTGVNSFWDIGATGVSVSEGGEGLSTAVMTSLSGFIAEAGDAWSFEEEWAPPDGTNRARLYALEPVVWAVPADVSEVYGDTVALALSGGIFGGPASYLFDDPDDTLPGLVFDSAGLPNGDVGTYPITVPESVFSALNIEYDVVQSPADLVITPRPLAIRGDDQNKTYGETLTFDPANDFSIVAGTLVPGDSVATVELQSDGTPGQATVAGSPYDIVAGNARGSGLGNYAIDYRNNDEGEDGGRLAVNRAQLSFAAEPKTRTIGSTNPLLTGSYSGFVLGEATEVLTTTASLSTSADQASPVGQYTIDAFGPPLDGNYAILYRDSALTVEPLGLEDRVDSGDVEGGRPDAPGTDVIATDPIGPLDSVTGAIGAADLEVAAAILETVRLYSNGLEADAASCRQSEAQISDYLSCISEALESFAASLEEIALQLPPELREVSATIRSAAGGVDVARRRAESRLATAATPEARTEIVSEAVAEARAAVASARNEIRIAIELIRVEDSDLAQIEAATGGAIAAALETVEIELVRATEL